jgi:hypothetical protein
MEDKKLDHALVAEIIQHMKFRLDYIYENHKYLTVFKEDAEVGAILGIECAMEILFGEAGKHYTRDVERDIYGKALWR